MAQPTKHCLLMRQLRARDKGTVQDLRTVHWDVVQLAAGLNEPAWGVYRAVSGTDSDLKAKFFDQADAFEWAEFKNHMDLSKTKDKQ